MMLGWGGAVRAGHEMHDRCRPWAVQLPLAALRRSSSTVLCYWPASGPWVMRAMRSRVPTRRNPTASCRRRLARSIQMPARSVDAINSSIRRRPIPCPRPSLTARTPAGAEACCAG